MQKLLLLLLCLSLFACEEKIGRADLENLNGYWEIEEVEGPAGQSRDYGLNPTIDFVKLDGADGYRKKLQPQVDGTFITSDDAALFSIQERDGRFYMLYRAGDTEWEERLLNLGPESFSVVNQENYTYHYRRYQPLVTIP